MSHDYTPLPDPIVKELGVYAASVYGRVWRYCQLGRGACTAAAGTIAEELDIDPSTVKRHQAKLVEAGYLTRTGTSKDGRPITHHLTAKWVMGGSGGVAESTTPEVGQKATPQTEDLRQKATPPKAECNTPQGRMQQGVGQKALGGGAESNTRDIPSSSSGPLMVLIEEEESASAPAHPRSAHYRRYPARSASWSDPADEMQAAILDGCGLDLGLTRKGVLAAVADFADQLKSRGFTADEVRDAAAAWPERFPDRDPGDVQPPHPDQLAEWVGRRKAAKAMAAATTKTAQQKALREAEDQARWLKSRETAQARASEASDPDPRAAQAWQGIADQLRAQMSPATWNTWLAPTRGTGFDDDDGCLLVMVASSYAEDWIAQRLGTALAPMVEAAGLAGLRFVAADAAGEELAA